MVKAKQRYLVVRVCYGANDHRKIGTSELKAALHGSIAENFGDYTHGIATSTPLIIYYNPLTSIAVIRSSKGQFREVWLSITLITHIGFEPARIDLLKLTGAKRCAQSSVKYHSKFAFSHLPPDKQEEEVKKVLEVSFLSRA